jgi:hypothetical protein
MSRFALALVGAMFLSLVSGCQTAPKTAMDTASPMPSRALLVSGGNSGGMAVFIPGDKPGEVAILASSDTPACAQCNADAVKYFQTGELVAKCPVCGATRTPLSSPASISSHAHN